MSKRIQNTPLADLLPESIRHDAGIAAAADALDPALRQLVLGVPNLLLFSRLDPARGRLSPPLQRLTNAAGGLKPLSEPELELLAWQFHVDFREVARNPAELAGMVRDSIPWHRIKGTPASIYAALEMFGFGTTPSGTTAGRAAGAQTQPRLRPARANVAQDVRPSGIIIEESLPGQHWATYQLGLPDAVDMDSVRRAVRVAEAMAPVRCRLGRVYNSEFDFRPAVWGADRWSEAWWSLYSGVPLPDSPDAPDTDSDIIVSFGARLSLTCPPLAPRFASGMASLMSCLAPYLDKPVWGRTRWGGIMPVNLPFIFSQLYGSYFGSAFFDPPRIDRIRPAWRMGDEAVSRSQAVWGEIEKKWCDTAAYGTVIVRHIEAPAIYSLAAYGDSQGLHFEVLHELSQHRAVFLLPAWGVGVPIFGTAGHSAFRVPRRAVPVWGESAWGDIFAGNKPFFGQSLFSGCFGDRLTQPRKWRGSWRGPWRKFIGFGRKLPAWSMNAGVADDDRAVSRSQSVFGETAKAWGDGARYGTTVARRIEAPAVYGAAAYGDSQDLKIEIIHDI